eukprot:8114902-Ditylum_brightwellii.AAC.1
MECGMPSKSGIVNMSCHARNEQRSLETIGVFQSRLAIKASSSELAAIKCLGCGTNSLADESNRSTW